MYVLTPPNVYLKGRYSKLGLPRVDPFTEPQYLYPPTT